MGKRLSYTEGIYSVLRSDILCLMILLGITLLVFWPTFSNGFQFEWDDQWMLINHDLVFNPSWTNSWYYLTHYVDGQYFPLNQFYYVLLYQINRFDPFVYHTGSLFIHVINIFLVYYLVREIYSKLEITNKTVSWKVLLVTIIFAIHPLQVEAVAWISASKVLLYAFFMLSTLLIYFRYLETGKRVLLFVVMLGYLLGFMCKEQMIILPLILVLFDLFFTNTEINVKRLWLEKLPFF